MRTGLPRTEENGIFAFNLSLLITFFPINSSYRPDEGACPQETNNVRIKQVNIYVLSATDRDDHIRSSKGRKALELIRGRDPTASTQGKRHME